MFCVGELNTEYREDIQWPIFYGIGVDVKNGELFPASFSGVVPDYNLRQARCVLGLNEVRRFLKIFVWDISFEINMFYK